ncbi:MAG: helix-turn-helix transcriptional regulator [Spirochaetales bacterium]|nr:helix-turn-helix transcriptional regulator [Spirochaetales bacterium]
MNMNSPTSLFPKNLKRLRKAAGLTQDELAERCGKSKNYISQLEMGKRFPSGSMLDALCEETGAEAYEFFLELGDTYKVKKLDNDELAMMDSLKRLIQGYRTDSSDPPAESE